VLEIVNLNVSVENDSILNGVNLKINPGEIHAVMGPNGSGKSTLANVIAGHPRFAINKGKIFFEGEDLSLISPEERALMGIYLCFQNPLAIPGVSVSNFLRLAYNERYGVKISPLEFQTFMLEEIKKVDLTKDFLDRYLNEGFSGGEKKKMEMLQMRVLKPKMALLDEIDSGLDVDALKLVSENIADLQKEDGEFSVLIITHQRKILDYIKPDYIHIMIDGKIVRSDGKELINLVDDQGYQQFKG